MCLRSILVPQGRCPSSARRGHTNGQDRSQGDCRKETQRIKYLHEHEAKTYCRVKEAVFPFIKFKGVDTVLGPEMKSTGEVMGLDTDFGRAYAKSQMAADWQSSP